MSYYKWVRNADPSDWVARLELEDGTVIELGVPVEMSADDKKALEAEGRVFESSSKSEAEQVAAAKAGPTVGADTAISGPVFANEQVNQPGAEASGKDNK